MIRFAKAIVAIASVAGTAALAEEVQEWGQSGAWAILIDPSVGNGCFMERRLENGTLVQFGFVPDRKGGFFAAFNPEWTDIEDGSTGTVKFDFPKKRFSGESVGIAKDGRFGGYAFFDNPNLPIEFAKNNNMTVIGKLGRTVDIGLAGTSKAIKAVRACQEKQPK